MGVEGRFKGYYGRYIFVIRCDVEWYVVECLWPGWPTVCEVVQNGVVERAYGVKGWREIAVWCEMSWCDFKCFVVWIRSSYVKRSEQYALSVLRSVQCNVSSVLLMCQ